MNSASELYQSVILDHNRTPRNYGRLGAEARRARGHNPLCGDEVTVWLQLEGDTVADVKFEGQGCAISKASASLMTMAVKGRPVAEVAALAERFHDLVTGKLDEREAAALPSRLQVFGSVAQFPVRVKCASMPWHTLKAALAGGDGPELVELK
ncbi:MAG: SUF system NifU family Fe-S cluster assembly protein [Gemmatimonadales bacterium]|jgi:nitrogen fixation NifU-like protein|nr:SUF system NifU family Fe-S cluster assembly protein [Gemmatimonadales bacterium]